MSGRSRTRAEILLTAIGAAGLIAAVRSLSGGSGSQGWPPRRGIEREPAADDRRAMRGDLITYVVGYALALALTCAAFGLVHGRWMTGAAAFGVVLALALIQAIVHVRCFLHVDLRRSARDDLQLILFSTLIIALMVGGTLVVLLNLRVRMM